MASTKLYENTKDETEVNFEETVYRCIPFQAKPPVIHRQLAFQIPWHNNFSHSNAPPNFQKS